MIILAFHQRMMSQQQDTLYQLTRMTRINVPKSEGSVSISAMARTRAPAGALGCLTWTVHTLDSAALMAVQTSA